MPFEGKFKGLLKLSIMSRVSNLDVKLVHFLMAEVSSLNTPSSQKNATMESMLVKLAQI
jgi:hypothetical protein